MRSAIAILFFLSLASAGTSQGLPEHLAQAAELNPGVAARYAEFEAAMKRSAQVRGLPDPSLSIGYFISPVETRIGPQRARFSLTQMFPWFGTLGAQADVADRLAEAKYAAFLEARNELFFKVRAAYYPLYELDRLIALERDDLDILKTYAQLLLEFYFSLILLWVVLIGMGALFLGRRIRTLVRYIRQPLMIAFSTASSEAALPKLFEQLDRFGVPRRISGFMLPLGYSFNLDGSMMYMSFATIFIAQAYGIDLSIGTQIMILLTLMISSKGIAAVPRASLVVITGTLAMFGLPVEGVAIILAIDQFLDMGRTATNVVGNAVATSVITKWEGMLEVEEPEFVAHPHAPANTVAAGKAGLELDETNFEEQGRG